MDFGTTLLWVDSTPPDQGGYPGFRPSISEVDGVLTERDVAVAMRDGTIIYVDVCRPAGAAHAPVLIAYGPYGKHNGFPPILAAGADIQPPLPPGVPFEAPVAQYWVKHGYAVIYADPRGCWGSQGDASILSAQEAQDGRVLQIRELTAALHCGLAPVQFLAPVREGSQIRATVSVMRAAQKTAGVEAVFTLTYEVNGEKRQRAWPT